MKLYIVMKTDAWDAKACDDIDRIYFSKAKADAYVESKKKVRNWFYSVDKLDTVDEP